MKKILLTLAVSIASTTMFAQGAKNIKINEVLTNNTASLQDGLGQRLPWVELANTSYSTYRGFLGWNLPTHRILHTMCAACSSPLTRKRSTKTFLHQSE